MLPTLDVTGLRVLEDNLEDVWLRLVQRVLNYIFALPGIATMVLYIVVGYIIGWISQRVVLTFKDAINKFTSGTFLDSFTRTVGTDPAGFMASFIRWIITFVFLVGAVNVANIPWLSEAMATILNYLPNLLAGMFIIIVGTIIGKYVGMLVEISMKKAEIEMAEIIGLGVRLFIYYIVIIMGLAQMGIDVEILYIFTRALAYGIGAGIGIGVAVAVALSLKDRIHVIIKTFLEVKSPRERSKKRESGEGSQT